MKIRALRFDRMSVMIRSANDRAVELAEDIGISERLSRMQGQEIGPTDVVKVLQKAKVRHVLVGAHAISAWAGDPRATIDVDLVASNPAQARKALESAFPDLAVEEQPDAIRFTWEGKERIDVLRPSSSPLFKEALKFATKVKLGRIQVDVPKLEMALALKFGAMISGTRPTKDKYQDAHDFMAMIEHNKFVDLEKIERFGELAYAGGGKEILRLVKDARAGKRLEF
jgi:hypothetical protein